MSSLSRKFVAAGFAGVFGAGIFNSCAGATGTTPQGNFLDSIKIWARLNKKTSISIFTVVVFIAISLFATFTIILPKLRATGTQTEEQGKDGNDSPDESDIPDKGDTQTYEDNQEQIDNQKSGMSNGTKALIGGGVVLGTAAVGTGIAAAIKSKKGDVDVGKTEDSGHYMFLGSSNATSMANTGTAEEEEKQDLGTAAESKLDPENKEVPLDAFREGFSVKGGLGKGEGTTKDKEPEKIDE